MNLLLYFDIIVRRGWIIVLLCLLTAISTFVLTNLQNPVYRSTQLVLMQPSRPDLGLSEANKGILSSYTVYLNSSIRAQEIIDKLQLDITPETLQSKISIEADTLRLYIQIDVEDNSPDVANRIATAYGQLLKARRDEQNQGARREDRIDAIIQDVARASISESRKLSNA